MINFEKMTVEQMKKYCSSAELQKLDNAELGQLLSAARSIKNYFSQGVQNIESMAEADYWRIAEKVIKNEFSARNIVIKVMDFKDVFRQINEDLKTHPKEIRPVVMNLIRHYDMDALLEIKQDLMEVPGSEKVFEEVFKLFDEHLGISSQNKHMLN